MGCAACGSALVSASSVHSPLQRLLRYPPVRPAPVGPGPSARLDFKTVRGPAAAYSFLRFAYSNALPTITVNSGHLFIAVLNHFCVPFCHFISFLSTFVLSLLHSAGIEPLPVMQFNVKRTLEGGDDIRGYELPSWALLVVLVDILALIPLFIIVS